MVVLIEHEQNKRKIHQYFKAHKLPKPGVINFIGEWAYGYCYAVTTGLIKLKHFCVYFKDDEILDVKER